MNTRWRITGRLTTTSPLHIGTGEVTSHLLLTVKNKDTQEERPADVQAIVKDHKGKPCIPGTAIKGVLRSWAEQMLLQKDGKKKLLPACEKDAATIDRIFGSREIANKGVEAGWAEFCTAFVQEPSSLDKARFDEFVPYWKSETLTGISSHVCIDRHTGAAKDGKLFYEEFVPGGVTFQLEIDATRLSADDITFLLAVLNTGSSHATHPIQFGANGADGWGRMAWDSAIVTTCSEVSRLLSNEVGFACCQSPATLHVRTLSPKLPAHISLNLELKFQGPFLVNDASRTHKKENDDLPNFVPLRRADGGVWLPASSFRGVLRERAEFLLRSLDEKATGDPNDALADGPIERIFGQTSQASVLTIEEFTEVGRCEQKHQDFVAIDRWTGGAADGAKFDAQYACRPQLQARLTLETSRLKPSDVALLGRALHDLCSGQIPLGWGGSKGYGAVQGLVTKASTLDISPNWNVPTSLLAGNLDESARKWLADSMGVLHVPDSRSSETSLSSDFVGSLRSVQQRGKNNTIAWSYIAEFEQSTGVLKSVEVDVTSVPESMRNRPFKGVPVQIQVDHENKVHIQFPSAAPLAGQAAASQNTLQGLDRFAHPYYFLRLDDRGTFASGLQDARKLPSKGPIGHRRFEAGFYSGTVQVKLKVETPLLICDDEDKAKRYSTPEGDHLEYPVRTDDDGKPLLASTSVRGMLRSAFESITNSRFGVFSDVHKKKLSFRPPIRGAGRKYYDRSPFDCLPLSLRPATSLDELSPADRVFGWVNQDSDKSANDARSAYRSHLCIGPISCLTLAKEAIERFSKPRTLAILGQPKPQQGRFYLGDRDGYSQKGALSKELSGYTGSNRIRGPKVYPHHAEGVSEHDPSAYTTDISIQNRSISGFVKPATEFAFELHFTNLSRTELSALIWLLTLPPEHYLRLGLGKPLGFGSVRVSINEEGTCIADGEAWIQSLKTWGRPPASIDRMPLVTEFAEVMSSANNSVLNEFLTAASGFGPTPIHYPRTSEQQLGSGENFKWFVQNEKLRAPHSLPDLLSDPLLPVLIPPPRH